MSIFGPGWENCDLAVDGRSYLGQAVCYIRGNPKWEETWKARKIFLQFGRKDGISSESFVNVFGHSELRVVRREDSGIFFLLSRWFLGC